MLGFMRRLRRLPRLPHGPARSRDLTAFIDEGTEIEGTYNFSGTVMLNGRLAGEIVSNDTLIVGEKGVVHANIRAGVLLVSGEVVGNVHASERVELRGKARLVGDLETPVIVVEEGVLFEGQCRMTKGKTLEAAPPVVPAARDRAVVSLTR
jgi:cytoskeletal protein CcmA (bactofilin family)